VIDYVGGLSDLATRTVRTIGDPQIRFREDPVRILRAIKFSARLDFNIEPSAYQAILDFRGDIPKCAPPRVLEEIYRLLRGGAARRSMQLLRDTGVLSLLLPHVAALLLERGDSQEARWLWQLLDRIDAGVAQAPPNTVLLSVLAAPFLGEALLEDQQAAGSGQKVRDLGLLLDERIRPMFEQMRVSRRDAERTRQILLALRRVAPSKRRRGRATTLSRRDYFSEAMQVIALVGPVLRPGELSDEELQRGAAAAQAEAGAEAPEGEGPEAQGFEPRRRRRRRRGGKRRLHETEAAEEAALGSPDEPLMPEVALPAEPKRAGTRDEEQPF
jgi:poly(A) polymerase